MLYIVLLVTRHPLLSPKFCNLAFGANSTEMIRIIRGDITSIAVDAIVNAANSALMGGGGVDGAIHRAGGPVIHEECMQIVKTRGRCSTGEAVITKAGSLPAKYVIHTVGPVWNGGLQNEDELLSNAYVNSLKLAVTNNVQTISFPNISTGVYGFPKDRAAGIAYSAVSDFLKRDNTIKEVLFVCFDNENYYLYKNLADNAFRGE
jgi:O-acetyl-ADP-ribose deacetylase